MIQTVLYVDRREDDRQAVVEYYRRSGDSDFALHGEVSEVGLAQKSSTDAAT